MEAGLPLLRERGMPAVCFVVAGLIGTDTPFWPHEVTHLVRSGASVPGLDTSTAEACLHALKQRPEGERERAVEQLRRSVPSPAPRERQLTGPELRELEAGGVAVGNHTLTHPCLQRCDDVQARAEVLAAHDRLTALLGHPPTSFAYPNGDFAPMAHRALLEAGYRSGFLYDHGLAAPGVQHPLMLSWLRVSTSTPRERLETVLSGLQPAVYRAVRATGRAVLRARPGRG
ncbi:polysaccharide deacetylase family protein [Kitasatospora arboriphila]